MVFCNASFAVGPRLTLQAEGIWSRSTFDFDAFELPEPEEQPANWNGDFASFNAYSDLTVREMTATVGAGWRLSPGASLHGSVSVMDLHDSEPYVYGDQSGRVVVVSSGMDVAF